MSKSPDEARVLLQRMLDDELRGPEADAARVEIEMFPELSKELRAHEALQRSLRGLPSPSLPAGFEARLAARLEASPSLLDRLRAQWRAWMLPLSLVTAAAAAGVFVIARPGAMEGNATGVAGASFVSSTSNAPEVTVRVRAGKAQWAQVRSAMTRAGLAVSDEPVSRGRTWIVETDASVTTVNLAANELSGISSVEVVGMPSTDVPVKLRVVLTQP